VLFGSRMSGCATGGITLAKTVTSRLRKGMQNR